MKASKFSEAQKAFILKQGADGVPVADICRKAGISQATYFNWKKKYDGLLPTEMRRLKLTCHCVVIQRRLECFSIR
jgi:putative transposase